MDTSASYATYESYASALKVADAFAANELTVVRQIQGKSACPSSRVGRPGPTLCGAGGTPAGVGRSSA
jgi:hypothetical protein